MNTGRRPSLIPMPSVEARAAPACRPEHARRLAYLHETVVVQRVLILGRGFLFEGQMPRTSSFHQQQVDLVALPVKRPAVVGPVREQGVDLTAFGSCR